MNGNGNYDPITEAVQQALAQQEAIPPPYVPPADWLTQQIAAQEQITSHALAQVAATEVYQAYMREVGALNKLREWQMAALLQQQKDDST